MPGISGSSGGSSDCCSVCAIADRVRYRRALSTAAPTRSPRSSAIAMSGSLKRRPSSVIVPAVPSRTRIGTASAHALSSPASTQSRGVPRAATSSRPTGSANVRPLLAPSRSSPSSSRWIAQSSASVAATSRATSGSVSSSSSDRASARELSARKRCASSACLISVMSSITLIASRAPPSSSTGLAFTRDQRDSPGWRTTSGSAVAPVITRRPGSSSAGIPSRVPSASAPPSSCAAAALT